MKSPKILLPIAFAALVLAAACVTEESESTETVGETAVTSTTDLSSAPETNTGESPAEQIAEGTEQIGEGLEEAGRGVAQATGKALQRAGAELEQAGQPKPDPGQPATTTAPSAGSATAGGRIYAARNCGACHGANGAGGTAIAQSQNIRPLGSPAVKGQSDAELARVLTQGKSPASAGAHKTKNLTPEEVRDLIAWIRSL